MTEKKRRVRILSMVVIGNGLVFLIFGVLMTVIFYTAGFPVSLDALFTLGIFLSIVVLTCLLTGYGLLRLDSLAWIGSIVLLGVFSFMFSITIIVPIINLISIVFLVKERKMFLTNKKRTDIRLNTL